jgi:haloalkane dehalogenase
MERPSWVDSELYPFEDRWAEVGGHTVHYVDEGNGPPLLMLHGNPTWSFTWRRVIEGLRDRFRCIAPDLPGFGLSKRTPAGYGFTPAEHAEAIEQLVQHLDLRDVTLLCQDWGGPVGFAVAGRQPQRFRAFAIGNTWAWSMKDNRGARVFSGVLGSPLGRVLIERRNLFVEKILPAGSREGKLPERVMDQYRGPFPTPESRKPVAVMPKQIIAATPWLEEVASRLTGLADRPALIVWPTRDQAFREGERKRWESTFPDHSTVLLEGARHYIGEDAPEEIVAAVRDWPAGQFVA